MSGDYEFVGFGDFSAYYKKVIDRIDRDMSEMVDEIRDDLTFIRSAYDFEGYFIWPDGFLTTEDGDGWWLP